VENKVFWYKNRKLFSFLATVNEAIDVALLLGISYIWYKGKLIFFE
jgi:hypothetical protein